MKAIRVAQTGGPEQLRLEEIERPEPKAGEALVRVVAAGVNFIEVYQRIGLYPMAMPYTPGTEFAGVVEAVGEGVTEVARGDRVATAAGTGAYAEYAIAKAEKLVRLPDGVDERSGAAAMLQGMTAHYLATTTFPLQPGMTCLVHAAAGGVGLLLCQIARMRGATVIGTTSTEEKAALAREAGADHVILYSRDDVLAEVKRITNGRGVNVAYDSVGQSTWQQSLASLMPRGMLVLFGQSSGAVPPFDPLLLSRSGSLFLTRPTLVHYTATREDLEQRAGDVLRWIGEGKLKLRIHKEYPLAEVGQAHQDLEARKTTGKVLLTI